MQVRILKKTRVDAESGPAPHGKCPEDQSLRRGTQRKGAQKPTASRN